jgi:hypothetical protein
MKRYPMLGRVRLARTLSDGALALAWGALSSLALSLPAQAKECVREDESVRVSGHVQRQHMTRIVEDRNNSRTQRDLVVTMVLREPMCVMLPDDVSLALRPRRIKEVQLLHPERLPNGRDQGILLDGRVTLASSNAHHMPVLVEVQSIPNTRSAGQPPATRNAAQPPSSANTTLAAARTFPR